MFRWLNTLATTITVIRTHKWGAEPQSEIPLPPGEAFEASNTTHDFSIPGVAELNPKQDPEQIAAFHEERAKPAYVPPPLGGFEPGTPLPSSLTGDPLKGPVGPVGGIDGQTGDAASDAPK